MRTGTRARRVVITGGPAAGKTAVVELLRRHLSPEVATVPEAATILFSGGFPRPTDAAGRRAVQRAIFAVQRSSEEVFGRAAHGLPLVCDRGSLDGAAYWPGGAQAFCDEFETDVAAEYARYDAVIFLETTAYGATAWPADGVHRTETPAEARRLDRRLRRVWEAHPRFRFIPHAKNFYEKTALCLIALHRVLGIGPAEDAAESAARAARAAEEKLSAKPERTGRLRVRR
jgi:predicted ATPase